MLRSPDVLEQSSTLLAPLTLSSSANDAKLYMLIADIAQEYGDDLLMQHIQEKFKRRITLLDACKYGLTNEVREIVQSTREIMQSAPAADALCNDGRYLLLAAEYGHIQCITLLLTLGFNVNATQRDCIRTPLFFATSHGHLECVRALLKAGASVEGCLMEAAQENQIECLKELIRAGAEVSGEKYDRYPPLHCAAMKGNLACLQELLRAGAPMNVKGRYEGSTALHHAVANNHIDCVKELLLYGAMYNRWNKDNETPLDVAIRKGHKEIVELLQHVSQSKCCTLL